METMPGGRLQGAVQDRLLNDPQTKDETIEVIADSNEVTLRGRVRSQDVKEAAERDARAVSGVALVINELEVAPDDNEGGGMRNTPPFLPYRGQ
jgi:osmotically-inducible protein OsmY